MNKSLQIDGELFLLFCVCVCFFFLFLSRGIVGTAGYIAPEVDLKGAHSPAKDVWSIRAILCAILYAMFKGYDPKMTDKHVMFLCTIHIAENWIPMPETDQGAALLLSRDSVVKATVFWTGLGHLSQW